MLMVKTQSNCGIQTYVFEVSTVSFGTNFLTITNLIWVRKDWAIIVRVTDAEWNIITNHYWADVTTGNLSFYGER